MDKNELINYLIEKNRLPNRREQDPNSCPCYNGTRCHNGLGDDEMICLLCVCPEYNRTVEEGGCNINGRDGKWFYNRNLPQGRIWDCSECRIPHTENFIRNYLKKFSLEELENIGECKTINDLWKFFDKM
jgi:Zn-finger protein